MKKLLHPFLLLLLISGMSFFHSTSALAEGETDTEKQDVEITLSPTGTLFDINNMKPGDWAPRTITISNSGMKDFNYLMELQNNGDQKLFNELLLEIQAADQKLYDGKLAAFTAMATRKLVSGGEESLNITIRFPEHLGNDFQGVQSAFTFTFTAEGKDKATVSASTNGMIDSGNVKSSGFTLPATATNIFNILLFGSILMIVGLSLMTIRHFKRVKAVQ
ncbi:hypothetical protein QWT69_02870 [Sporosarcina oncorhynchi]|uniref:LPXTG cell wall anchor domain-containing protein n=1 Tax=Sporosarcina oncorhynchi TaxID=3056444 RepID=A0ABZ0L7N6_9BACL|nr:hypothetical protein [Sporosarcina sp. T2O-4]WOV88083.1 hypothetical protein QWT69_02870 [Sporosarcina sp. T2O-4]